MLTSQPLDSLLPGQKESIQLDFNERLNWDRSSSDQLEVLKDIAGLANRQSQGRSAEAVLARAMQDPDEHHASLSRPTEGFR